MLVVVNATSKRDDDLDEEFEEEDEIESYSKFEESDSYSKFEESDKSQGFEEVEKFPQFEEAEKPPKVEETEAPLKVEEAEAPPKVEEINPAAKFGEGVKYPKFQEGESQIKMAEEGGDIDPEYLTPKNVAWLADIDFSVITGSVRPVGSGVCESAKCDGSDNDKCFETCGNMATPEDVYGCPKERTWSLTFDDGPSEFTNELLDILDNLNVKATFCVMGAHAKKYPDVIKRAYEAGHQIASHTYSHAHLMSLSNEDIVYEIRATEDAIEKAIGVKPKYIRPPYGEADQRVKALLKQMGYKVLMWNVDPTDYNVHMIAEGPELIQGSFQKVIDEKNSNLNIHSDLGFISLQHDLYQVSIQQIPSIVEALQNGNYTLLTSAACLGDSDPYGRLGASADGAMDSANSAVKPGSSAAPVDNAMSKNMPTPSNVQKFPGPSSVDPRVVTSVKAAGTPTVSKKNIIGKSIFKSDASHIIGYTAIWAGLIALVCALV
ncbi:hypothetical protein BY458DRAFT_553616 [Sporodiniella umbellata]|nr:hypothetical protein BY458DRAFT_553616 [Sporodiniella umbellata]